MDDAVGSIQSELNGPNAGEIRRKALDSALQGIKKGKMAYEGDPLLDMVIKKLDDFQKKADSYTDAELAKIVGITTEQKTSIKSNDARVEEAFINELPPIKHPNIISSPEFKALTS